MNPIGDFEKDVEHIIEQINVHRQHFVNARKIDIEQRRKVINSWYEQIVSHAQPLSKYFVLNKRKFDYGYKGLEIIPFNDKYNPYILIVPQVFDCEPRIWVKIFDYPYLPDLGEMKYESPAHAVEQVAKRLKSILVYQRTGEII